MAKHLIITADDFGLHEAVNEAVEAAYRGGVLSAASLMVSGPAAADAVRRAAAMPGLRVGLHLVLADGQATLDAAQIPELADAQGRMGDRMAYDGLRFFLLPRVRRQLEAEIRAQFSAFAHTGLELDHVNAHKHFHLHPTVLQILLRVARDYGRPAVRLPAEPLGFAFGESAAAGVAAALLTPWVWLLRRRLRRAGVRHNDGMFGAAVSGRMDEAKLLRILCKLPPGVTEIYLHPAKTERALTAAMREYRHGDELAALLSDRVAAAVAASGAVRGGFIDCLGAGAAA